jgi:hypothetical protein
MTGKVLTLGLLGALAVVLRKQLVRVLTRTTGTWVGTSE